jgi:hypothetical protein
LIKDKNEGVFIRFSFRHSVLSLREECQLTGNVPEPKFPDVSQSFQKWQLSKSLNTVSTKGIGTEA